MSRILTALLLSIACYAQDRAGADPDDRQLEREQWFYSQRQFPRRAIPGGARLNAIHAIRNIERTARNRLVPRAVPGASAWSLIGPQPTTDTSTYATSGRVNSIAIDPRDSNTIYIGAAEGGVWKTTDAGQNWTPLTDDQASLASGAVALDPSNPDIVYVGTGEENFSGDSYYGAGILKSTDAGQTWTNYVGPFQRAYIGSLSVNPRNGQVLLCASSLGIYRSADGGQTWARVLPGIGTTVIFDPTQGNIAYAAVGSPVGDSLRNGIYRSQDGGLTWNLRTGSGAAALPTANLGRIQLAMALSNTSTLYASIGNSDPDTFSTLLGIWKTTDGGQTWNQLPVPASMTSQWGNQTWYDNAIAVSPANSNVVFVGGVALFRSMDGGTTWQTLPQSGANGIQLHVDQHFLAFTPDGNTLYAANDGGVFTSSNITSSAVTWTNLNSTLALTEFYPGISLYPSDQSVVLGGTQDNGTQAYSGTLSWTEVVCGDGGFTAIDPAGSAAYAACQHLAIEQTNQGVSGWIPANYGIDHSDRSQFIAPMAIDPSNPQRLYFGSYRLWRSSDGAGKWSAISPDLSFGGGAIQAVAVSPSDPNTIYTGSSDGRVSVTRNALATATNWTNITTGLPRRSITHIAVNPVDPTIAYVTFSGFSGGTDIQGHVFRTNNAGAAWTDISANLPNLPVNDLAIDPDIPGTLYAATDAGVMVSADDGGSWNSLGAGLPRVVVTAVAMHRSARLLRAATHGRSVWEISVPLRGVSTQPVITSITPTSVNAGSADFTIAITGSNFGPNAKVRWNGLERETTVTDSTRIQASITAADVAAAGRGSIFVFDPTPGSGASNSVSFTIGPAPASTSNAAVSAANPLGGPTLGQRSISSLYGTNLSGQTLLADQAPPLPFTLGGATMTIGDNPVPLFFVSPNQVNFQVPFLSVTKPTQVPLVFTQGSLSTTITVTLTPYAPAIFTTNSQGSGQASALINGTASIAAPVGAYPNSRPAKQGEYVDLYATGLGDVMVRPALGSPSPSSPDPTLATPTVTLGGQTLDPSLVVYSGLAPGFVGLYQVNFQIPHGAPTGDAVPVMLTIGGQPSNTATIAIQ